MKTILRLQTAISYTELRNRCTIISRIAVFLILLTLTGCNVHGISQTNLDVKTEFDLNSPNFTMETVNASGQASCFYILFSIPLCRDQNLATLAWEEMRQGALLEGKSAQFVNVIEDRSLNWNFLYLFFQDN
jgi:hypothetical protein